MKSAMLKCFVAFAVAFGSTVAHADGDKLSVANNPKWKEECGSCHIAYPPQFLTAESWQLLMGGLNKHFGANAMLDAKDNRDILDFLQRNAGSGSKHSTSSLRISETPWFSREHREVSSNTWSKPSVKSRANCAACHVNAERGDWSERGIRMPGGSRHGDDD
jgi:nitrate/TMAO reductase-like tetraheme cytochrome c subunit